jgi:hypothetical protein
VIDAGAPVKQVVTEVQHVLHAWLDASP